MKRFKIALPRRKTPLSTGCIVNLKFLAIVFEVLFVFVLASGVVAPEDALPEPVVHVIASGKGLFVRWCARR